MLAFYSSKFLLFKISTAKEKAADLFRSLFFFNSAIQRGKYSYRAVLCRFITSINIFFDYNGSIILIY